MAAGGHGWGSSGGPPVGQSPCVCRSVARGLPGRLLHWRLVRGSITRATWLSPEPAGAECSRFLPSHHVSGSQLLPQTEI